jgi:hypothetical protein
LTEWWTYRPGSFLMFSRSTWEGLVASWNAEAWPLQAVALAVGLGVLAAAWRGGTSGRDRGVAAVLALAWAHVGWAFLHERFAPVNWAADYVAGAFGAQAAALAWVGTVRGKLTLGARASPRGRVGLGIAGGAILLWPLLPAVSGRPWSGVEVFGLMPGPTVVATLGLLVAARRAPGWLMAIPVAACGAGGAMLWALKRPDAWIAPAAAAMGVACLAAWRARGAGEPAARR